MVQTIWEATLDGRYICSMDHLVNDLGELIVIDTLNKDFPIKRAIYKLNETNPLVDVSRWQELIINFLEGK